jgi:hypothetical protein
VRAARPYLLGGLYFGHPAAAVFTAREGLMVSGIAAQAAVGIDYARLYRASRQATLEQRVTGEINERLRTEEALHHAQRGAVGAAAPHALRVGGDRDCPGRRGRSAAAIPWCLRARAETASSPRFSR